MASEQKCDLHGCAVDSLSLEYAAQAVLTIFDIPDPLPLSSYAKEQLDFFLAFNLLYSLESRSHWFRMTWRCISDD